MESGGRTNPIWLLFDPRHPIRHDIWTPILDEVQDKVYRQIHRRVDTSKILIRNAINNSLLVPNTLNWWADEVVAEIELFREIALEHKPKILISFGAFAYEFVRRVYRTKPKKGPKHWGTSILGDEFRSSIENFDINTTNSIPLLRRVIASGNYIEAHNYFCQNQGENYFNFVGIKIAEKIIEHKDDLQIWIK
ncbi:MAG TPA: hypothetical protein DD730_16640 [Desulfosporosinus sp.]|jgi:hypothetical protein|nr:hypothetical protein [Desulfosporosinus sp.]